MNKKANDSFKKQNSDFFKIKSIIGGILSIIAIVCEPTFAEEPQATLITDPDILESLGFASDVENIYMDIQKDALSLIGNEDEVGDMGIYVTPTTGVDHSAISAKAFIGRTNPTGTAWAYDTSPISLDISRTGTERFADAQFTVPTGSTLTFFRWWAHDSNASSDLALFVFEVCQPGFVAGPITTTTIVALNPATTGSGGDQTGVASLSVPVNNRDCTYVARVRFDDASTNLRLQKVRLQFNR